MRTMLSIALAAGCTSSAAVPARPLGVQDHLTEAERHDADAAALEQRAQAEDSRATLAPPYVCGDQPGLTADWLRQTLACHHALAAAAGFEPTYLATCPAVVAGAETTVQDDPAGLVVVVRASDAAAGLTIYARAEALLGPASASTAHVH